METMKNYPQLEINHDSLRHNINVLKKWCKSSDIEIAGVIKGANAIDSVIEDFVNCGVKWLASSRTGHLAHVKSMGIKTPTMLIRSSMLSSIDEVLENCDYSLQTEIEILKRLNEKALSKSERKFLTPVGKHGVVLMLDLGDLREGFIEEDELISVAKFVDSQLKGLYLAGIGTNLGCYGSVVPTSKNMNRLAHVADIVENKIGRKLEIVSGGATSSIMPVLDGVMPKKINMLRIGAAALVGSHEDIRTCYGREEFEELSSDAFLLKAEVIEVNSKPTYPIGELGVDAFGKKGTYIDRGCRKRAIVAIGRADYGDISDLIIKNLPEAKIFGASGDHTLIDIEDVKDEVCVGDIIEFNLKYNAILNLTHSEDVAIKDSVS